MWYRASEVNKGLQRGKLSPIYPGEPRREFECFWPPVSENIEMSHGLETILAQENKPHILPQTQYSPWIMPGSLLTVAFTKQIRCIWTCRTWFFFMKRTIPCELTIVLQCECTVGRKAIGWAYRSIWVSVSKHINTPAHQVPNLDKNVALRTAVSKDKFWKNVAAGTSWYPVSV